VVFELRCFQIIHDTLGEGGGLAKLLPNMTWGEGGLAKMSHDIFYC
jgi:hypothetical protein